MIPPKVNVCFLFIQAPEAEPEALFYRFARIVCKVFHRDGPFCMLRSGRGNGHFNAALPFAYIHTVIPAPYDGTVRIWDLDEYREVGGYGIITHINLSGANFELAIIDQEDKEILKAVGAKV